MKKITAIIVLFMTLFFIITPANAKSEVTIHLVEDKLARTFDNFYNGDKKTIYAFAYDTNNTPFSIEIDYYLNEELFYYEIYKEEFDYGRGNLYIALLGKEVLLSCSNPYNRKNNLPFDKILKKVNIPEKVSQKVTYLREEKKTLKQGKNLILSSEAAYDNELYRVEVFAIPN